MKYLTQDLKDASVKKWEEIVEHIEKKDNTKLYRMYWTVCGFCRAASGMCDTCSLHRKHAGMVICYRSMTDEMSHAYSALLEADCNDWKPALKHAKIVLAAIKRTRVDMCSF